MRHTPPYLPPGEREDACLLKAPEGASVRAVAIPAGSRYLLKSLLLFALLKIKLNMSTQHVPNIRI